MPPQPSSSSPPSPSHALLSAALAGLLCSTSCAPEPIKVERQPASGDGGASAGGAAAAGGASSGGTSGAGGAATGGTTAGTGGMDASPGAGGTPSDDSGAPPDASHVPPDSSIADAAPPDPFPDATASCAIDAGPRVITRSEVVPGVTLDAFTASCDALGGAVELHAHCGGANSCRGMSYDTDTLVFTEHTCRGLNTCSGFSCVLCPETRRDT